jgi:DNA-directed RNA polymerase subunit RPC12/RpoP
MARIICLNCGNEISEEAKNCPFCGVPIQYDDLICPKCSSKALHKEKDGFNDVMAIGDWVLFGGAEILPRTNGSKDIFFTCLKCENRFKAG